MEQLKKRLSGLLTVKSVVTIALTAIFAFMVCSKQITGEQFIMIYTTVIAFYFGTQSEKKDQTGGDTN